MRRVVFVLKTVGLAVLGIGFVASWGLILTRNYGVLDAPIILLSSINAVAVVALAFFTYSYMKSTKSMADAMKASNDIAFEMNHRPRVVVEFKVRSTGAIYIFITNQGKGAARNITFDITPALVNSTGDTTQKWPALKQGINYLAPNQNVTFFFDTAFAFLAKPELPKDYKVKVEYDWAVAGRSRISEESPLALSPLLGTDLASYKDMTTLISEVEKIRQALEKR